jgi:hypothetical protein
MRLLNKQISPSFNCFISLMNKYFLIILFSDILNPFFFLRVEDQVSHPYKTKGRSIN